MRGRFLVDGGGVASAAGALVGVAGRLAEASESERAACPLARAVAGPAGAALADLMVAWQGAAVRLAAGMTDLGIDTGLAVERYRRAEDANTLPAAPPPPVGWVAGRSRLWLALHPAVGPV